MILLRRLPPFPRFATLVGSTTIIPASLGGVSGGTGAFLCRPMDFTFPVLNNSTACRVRCTLRVALEVFKITTAHSSKVVGVIAGTSSSLVGSLEMPGNVVSLGTGVSAKAVSRVRYCMRDMQFYSYLQIPG